MDGFVEIDLKHLIGVVLKKWWLIISAAIVCCGIAFVYTEFFVVPMYRTNISVYVNNSSEETIRTGTFTNPDLAAAQRLVNTYVAIITSNTVLEKVADNTGTAFSAMAIRSMMSSAAVRDTEIFEVTVTNESPETAALIANKIADVAVVEIPGFLRGSSVKIIDYAETPLSPYTPNMPQNLAVGAFAGLLIIVLIVALIEIFDKRIKGEEDLERLSDLPVLGAVPDVFEKRYALNEYGYDSKGKVSKEGAS